MGYLRFLPSRKVYIQHKLVLNLEDEISPQKVIEKLTEIFGAVGFGWKTSILRKEIIEGANGEK